MPPRHQPLRRVRLGGRQIRLDGRTRSGPAVVTDREGAFNYTLNQAREFFPDGRVRSNFLVNLGHGDRSKLHPRSPRLAFDEAARIL